MYCFDFLELLELITTLQVYCTIFQFTIHKAEMQFTCGTRSFSAQTSLLSLTMATSLVIFDWNHQIMNLSHGILVPIVLFPYELKAKESVCK